MATVFTRIISGELPGVFLHRDRHVVVFLSINPIARGHALVVPVREVDQWTDLTAEETSSLFDVARRVGRAMRTTLRCERVGLIVAGFEVPHCHLHVIPADDMSALSFANAAASVDGTDLLAVASELRPALDREGLPA
jgi:diadenosine tetraphosphate (Ap4A) HIT family hydrolase